ncbi:hypothetical protein [Pararhodobacter sp. SW119]|uniref:hypothetical protein n=1 Tax=Pararhodobacter sp. SW119 TaxID=2780075 RepID=UPI001FD773B7|nr:hypothetical protein [Pararhodobacter sp. SW119]
MLDSTAITLTMTPAWQAHLSPGDIVTFRFPLSQADPSAAPKPRPCLVLEIEELAGLRFALIAYGTTSARKANWGYEIHALHEEDFLGHCQRNRAKIAFFAPSVGAGVKKTGIQGKSHECAPRNFATNRSSAYHNSFF